MKNLELFKQFLETVIKKEAYVVCMPNVINIGSELYKNLCQMTEKKEELDAIYQLCKNNGLITDIEINTALLEAYQSLKKSYNGFLKSIQSMTNTISNILNIQVDKVAVFENFITCIYEDKAIKVKITINQNCSIKISY